MNRAPNEYHWVPHSYGLVPHMFSDKINKLETYTYVRTKWIILKKKNTNLSVDQFIFNTYRLLLVPRKKSEYFKKNRSTNYFKCGILFLFLWEFSLPALADGVWMTANLFKSLADLNNALVWIELIRPLIWGLIYFFIFVFRPNFSSGLLQIQVIYSDLG